MSVLFTDREHLQRADSDEDAAVEEIYDAIRALPPGSQEEVQRELARAIYRYHETRRVDPLLHFVESLFVTARLHRNPRYAKALAESMDEAEPTPDAVDTDGLAARFEDFWRHRSGE